MYTNCKKNVPLLVLAAALTLSSGGYAAGSEAGKAPAKAEPAKAATDTKAAPASAGEVVARVNGAPVQAVELRRAKKVMLSGQPGMEIPPERQKEFDQQAIDQLVSAELLYQAGQKLEIKDLDKQVEARISQGKSRFQDPKEFEKAVQALEMTEKDLREYTRRDLIISNYIQQQIASKIVISEEESRKFYNDNQDKFNRGASVRASHILIGVDSSASDEDKKKAREKAVKLRKELASGADFATLAKESSTCPSSQQGGDLGYFEKGQMVPPFEQAAFSLKPGEMSDVVETQFGYHVIKVQDAKKAETVPFKEAKPRIEEYLKGQKVSSAVSDYLAEARKKATIEVLLK